MYAAGGGKGVFGAIDCFFLAGDDLAIDLGIQMGQHAWQTVCISLLQHDELAIDIKRILALLKPSLAPHLVAYFAICRLGLVSLESFQLLLEFFFLTSLLCSNVLLRFDFLFDVVA